MRESLMASDATPFLIILLFGIVTSLFMMYYTRELRELPSKPAVPAKKKRRPVATR